MVAELLKKIVDQIALSVFELLNHRRKNTFYTNIQAKIYINYNKYFKYYEKYFNDPKNDSFYKI